jgi:hypothetical protein
MAGKSSPVREKLEDTDMHIDFVALCFVDDGLEFSWTHSGSIKSRQVRPRIDI